MSTPQILTPTVLLTHAQPSIDNANSLLGQSERAVIDSQEAFDKLADAIKITIAQEKKVDEVEGKLVDPLTAHVKWIRAQFKPIKDALAKAKENFKAKGLAWSQAEEKRRAAEAAELQRIADEQALEDARVAQESGDTERANALIDLAASTPKADTSVKARGDFTGASAGTKYTWKGEVTDVREFCKAIANGELPVNYIDVSKLSKTLLNSFAHNKQVEGTYFGIKVERKADLNIR